MNANLDKIAKDLYGKIQTRFPNINIGDENAAVLSKKEDIPKARFFEFEYEEHGEPLGTIAITLDADDGVVVQVSGDLVNDDNKSNYHSAYKFIRGFRQFAKDRLLNFDVQNIGKSNLDKRDYHYQAKRKEEPVMAQQPVMESKLYGNARMSYQDLGEARLVIKHNQPVNTDLAAGRTMHIESIYIENAEGERFKYPFKHLTGARALAEHIKHGGIPYDAIGQHIIGLSEELGSLRKFKGYVNRQDQLSEAMANVTSRVTDRIDYIKETLHKLQRTAYYESFIEGFEEQEEQMIPEEVQNDLIDRLTIRTFNEDLKAVFPYIYKFVDESELPVLEVGADDLLDERRSDYTPDEITDMLTGKRKQAQVDADAESTRGPDKNAQKQEGFDPELAYEAFMNDIIREDKDELFSPNKDAQHSAVEKMNQILAKELKGGPEGINAIQSLKGLIDDPEFLQSLQDVDPDLDVRPLIQQFVMSTDPAVAVQLKFSGEETGGGEQEAPPAAPPSPAPAPAAPPAPDAAAAPAPAPDAAAGVPPGPTAPAAAPVAEGKKKEKPEVDDDDPPFDPDPKPHGKTTAGKYGQGYSQARHLARQGLEGVLKKAAKAGATLETQLDFGNKVMTIAEICDECGMSPQDAGFDDPTIGGEGLPGMLKYISGFYNRDDGNFPLGGTRIKIKVKKAFEDGEFGGASEEDLMKVLKFIDAKDPSGNEHNHIMRLAGVKGHDREMDEQQGPLPDFGPMMQGILSQFNHKDMPDATVTHTSSGTINGKPASHDDAMAQLGQMKFRMPKFGDDDTDDGEIDFNNPDDFQQRLTKKVGSAFNKVQPNVPNQNVQFPGGQMNPQEMMKAIMQKLNFNKE